MTNALKFLEDRNGATTIGMLFRAYRTKNDLTQDQLAEIISVGKSLVSDIENDRKSLSISKCVEYATKMEESVILFVKVWFEQSLRNEHVYASVELKPMAEASIGVPVYRRGTTRPHRVAAKKATKKIASSTRKKVYA